MNSPEVPHEGPEEEMPDEAPAPVTAPPPTPSAARGPRTPERAALQAPAQEFDIQLVKLTQELKNGVKDNASHLNGDDVLALIKAVEAEHKDLIKDDSDLAKAYRGHISEFRSALSSYLARRKNQKDKIHASLRGLKKTIQAPEGEADEAAAESGTVIGKVASVPRRILGRVEGFLDRLIPGAARLEKKNKAA